MLQGAGELFGVVQCLVSLISLSLLNVTRSIEYVAERYAQQGAVEYPQIAGKPYLEDDECVRLLTNTVLGAADRSTQLAAPALFSWGIIAQTIRDVAYATREAQLEDGSSDSESPARLKSSLRGSRNSMARPSRIQTLLELIMDVLPGDDPIAIMGTAAVNALQVFDVVSSVSDAFGSLFSAPVDLHITAYAKLALMSLLREGLPLVQYSPGIVQALLSVISYDSPSGTTAETLSAPEPALTMVSDEDIFTPRFIGLVHSRYPHELSPLLEFSTALNQSRRSSSDQGPDVANVLDSMVTFTYKLPVDFNDYELVREDEVSNCIQLTSDLPFFESRAISTTGRLRRPKALLASDSQVPSHSEGQLAIPAGTVGVVVSDTRPFVVCWQFEHSGLEYLGNLLATRCLNSTILDAASLQPLDRLTAAQIVQLITSLLHSAADKDDPAAAKFVLGRLSYGLQRNDDIIRVVSDMFEEELQALIGRPNLEGSLPLLVACVQLMRALLTTYPERVWSFLIRSSLISVDETSCGLASVVGATEVPSGRYDFLASCTDLFAGLVEDAISRAVSRNNSNSKAVARFEDQARSSGSTPDRMLGAVLLAFERVSVDVLQSLSGWKFDIPGQRLELNAKIIATLNSVLSYHYRVGGDSDGASAKPTTFLAKASEALLDTFLADGPQQVTLQSILNIFTTTVTDVGSTISSQSRKAILAQARAALTFCSTLLSVSLITGRNAARVTSQLFKAVPIITRMFATQHALKAPTAKLLTSLVRTAGQDTNEPPSLLGHLGTKATKCFLNLLAELDQPLWDIQTEVSIWKLLSAVVSNNQQWLAICILTGSTPRDRLKDAQKATNQSRVKPLLTFALDELSQLKTLSPVRAIAMLEFVALAQNHWTWATNDIKKHSEFIKSVTDWLADIVPESRSADTEAATRFAKENQMAAYIADILAMYLYNARQSGDNSLAKTVTPKLQYLRDYGVAIDGYNHSLHKNLIKNFSNKFPGCSLASFKRTALQQAEFGREYYYDLELASKTLDFEPSWSRRNNQGFVDEVARANVNMSVVESQVTLLKSWKVLAIELSFAAVDDAQLQKDLCKVIEGCLKANMDAPVPVALFDNLSQLRVDLAFVLLQRLTNIKSKEDDLRDLLPLTWEAVRTSGLDFDIISNPRDATYYRSLLRTLFLSIQPQIYNPPNPVASNPANTTGSSPSQTQAIPSPPVITPLVLEMLQKAIANNFRALCGIAHSSTSTSDPTDFVLISALLQSLLRIPGLDSSAGQITTIFADSNTVKYATSLYSWSDRLVDASANNDNDPIYGELAILFLLALSSVPGLATHMAITGTLAAISAANLSQHLRKRGGCGPFDAPMRMHQIWARGLLPLCLNLVAAVGAPLAAEVASFVNSFPQMLERVGRDVEGRPASRGQPHAGAITAVVAAELHSLALLDCFVERVRQLGPAVGVVSAEVPGLQWDRVGVKQEVEGLVRGRRALRERIVAVGEWEAGLGRRRGRESGKEGSQLEEWVVHELEDAVLCLSG